MDWHLYQNGVQSGPISEEELFRIGQEGIIRSTDHVWNETMADWTPANEVAGLIGQQFADNRAASGGPVSEKESIIQELMNYSAAGPFQINRGTDTDLVITNEVTNSSWYSGKKTVIYTARLLVKENERTVYYWEMLKESSSGLSFSMGMQKRKIKGIEIFQQSREKGYAPGGELVYDFQFDYGSLREAFKQLLQGRGWKFKVVLMKGKASYHS